MATKPSRWNCHPSQPRNRIRYFAAPNVDKRAGGWCPLYRVNNQRMAFSKTRKLKTYGNNFCLGYDKPIAIKMAKAMAQDEADRHYGGDDCTTVIYSARGERGFAGASRRRKRR